MNEKLAKLSQLSDQDYAVLILLIGLADPEKVTEDPNTQMGAMMLRATFAALASSEDADTQVDEIYETLDKGVTNVRETSKRVLELLGG